MFDSVVVDRIVRRYFAEMPQRYKKNLIEAADHAVGAENLEDILDIGKDSRLLWKHRTGKRENIAVVLTDQLLECVEQRPGGISDDKLRHNAKVLDEQDQDFSPFNTDYREWLLKPYTNKELADESERAEATCEQYRHAPDTNVPNDLLVYLHQNKIERLNVPEPEVTIRTPGFGGEVLSGAGREDIAFYSFIEQDLDRFSSRSDDVLYMFEELVDSLEGSPGRYIGAGSDVTDAFCTELESAGVLSQIAEGVYRAERDAEYFQTALDEIETVFEKSDSR